MNNPNRRQFLAQVAGLSCAALGTAYTFVNTLAAAEGSSAPAIQTSATALLAKMKWLNEPASAKQSGEKFTGHHEAQDRFLAKNLLRLRHR